MDKWLIVFFVLLILNAACFFIQAWICKQYRKMLLDWRRVALRFGEELSASGPFEYYDMWPDQWLEWALAQLHKEQTK